MIVLGLGSNEGDRLQNLRSAVAAISKSILAGVETSSIYESVATLKPGSPDEWNKPFLNMAVAGETHLSPNELLKNIKMMEKTLGRQDRGVWAPREIDIDILAYEDKAVNTDELIIPHKSLCTRPFALLPLADVAPNWQYPAEGAFKGKTAYEISEQLFLNTKEVVKSEYEITADATLVA